MNRLPHDLPIEDLSDRSWSRVEDAVFRAVDTGAADAQTRVDVPALRRPKWRPVLGFASVAAAAAIAGFALLGGGGDGADPKTPAPPPSQRIATADDSSQVTAGDASLDIAPQSTLVMSGDDEHGVLVVLERGSVEFAVAPRRERPPYVVQAGRVRVVVVGTKFAVTRDGESAVVEVMKGTVRVTADGESTMVTAGEAWLAPTALEEIEEIEELEETEVATIEKRRKPPRKKPRRIAKHRRAQEPAAEPAPAPEPTAKELFDRAAKLEADDAGAALAIYRELSRSPNPTWAANALYARARLELEIGNEGKAATLLRRYLKRYPGGPSAEDARYLLGQTKR